MDDLITHVFNTTVFYFSGFGDLQKSLQDSINAQMEQLFENIDATVQELDEDLPHYDDELANRLIQKNNFVVEVKKSKIPQAQLGVFNRGTHVPRGQVMCLCPGLVHLPQYLTNEYMDKNLLPDDHYYLMARMDGCVIDGRTSHKVINQLHHHIIITLVSNHISL